MVLINVVVVNSQGHITALVQRLVKKDSAEYNTLKKKYLDAERDTLYTTMKVSFNVTTHHRSVWVETKV